MSHSRIKHGYNPPRYEAKANYGKESYSEHTSSKEVRAKKSQLKKSQLKKSSSRPDSEFTLPSRIALRAHAKKVRAKQKQARNVSGSLALSSEITLVSFTLLLLAAAAAAEGQKIVFSHLAAGRDVSAEIKIPDFHVQGSRDTLGDKPHLVSMGLASNSSKLTAHCLRTATLGCRIDGADQGHTIGLRSTHYAAINPNLDHDGPYPSHPTYAVTHHYQCSGQGGDLSTFDVLDGQSRTNLMLKDIPRGNELIIQHGAHGVVTEPATDLLTPSDGNIHARIVELAHPIWTAEVDRAVSLGVKKDFMSVDVSVKGVQDDQTAKLHASQQGDSITIQYSTLPGHELEFPPLKTTHGCRSTTPPAQTQHAAKHMALFYTPKRDTIEVELTTDMGITKASYPKKQM